MPAHPRAYKRTGTLPIVGGSAWVKMSSMQCIRAQATTDLPKGLMENKPVFRIVSAYQGIATGFRAWEMAAGLEAELKPAVEIVTDLWEFELLADPQLRGCAVADAAASDMVVISAGRGCELPAHVKKWMQTWLDRTRSRPAALVALLDQGANGSDAALALCSRLRRMAARGHLDYFCKMGDWERDEFEYVIDTIHQRSESRTAVLEEMVHRELRSLLDWIRTGRHSGLPMRSQAAWPGARGPSSLALCFGK